MLCVAAPRIRLLPQAHLWSFGINNEKWRFMDVSPTVFLGRHHASLPVLHVVVLSSALILLPSSSVKILPREKMVQGGPVCVIFRIIYDTSKRKGCCRHQVRVGRPPVHDVTLTMLDQPSSFLTQTIMPPTHSTPLRARMKQYIGVFGKPANTAAGGGDGRSIAMTAPVVTGNPSLDQGDETKSAEPRIFFVTCLLCLHPTSSCPFLCAFVEPTYVSSPLKALSQRVLPRVRVKKLEGYTHPVR